MFTKECPQCQEIINYTNKYNLKTSIKKNLICRKCKDINRQLVQIDFSKFKINGYYERVCPSCQEIIKHVHFKSFKKSYLKNCNCTKCNTTLNNIKQRKFDLGFLLTETTESFYWIGLLLTDGYIAEKEISLCLHKKDEEVIQAFKQICGSPNINIKGDSLRVSIKDKTQVTKFKEKFKITTPKTYNPPSFENFKNFNEDLLVSMLIGMIDGDGCIILNPSKKSAQIHITCHESWEDFYTSLFIYLNLPLTKRKINNTNCFRFSIGQKFFIEKIYKKIIEFDLYKMKRKWNKIEKLII